MGPLEHGMGPLSNVCHGPTNRQRTPAQADMIQAEAHTSKSSRNILGSGHENASRSSNEQNMLLSLEI